jgi:hypothetical protein
MLTFHTYKIVPTKFNEQRYYVTFRTLLNFHGEDLLTPVQSP